jgi:lipopolysaccharide/colanic/teichoic acid biosynthesis glycosyltransferase
MPSRAVRIAKRALDIAVASTGLALTAPLFPVLAAAIKLSSPGPVFIRQRRAGALRPGAADGRDPQFAEFTMYKFRSMRADAEAGSGPVLASEGDPRVTALGRILRKTRLDELPQFWNVLRGDMSVVGPRPERPELLRNFVLAIPFFEERGRGAQPGITGLAQVSLGYSGSIPEDSALAQYRDTLTNPFRLEGASGALADDMRAKLLYDLAYTSALESFGSYLRMELEVMAKTPLMMLRAVGR